MRQALGWRIGLKTVVVEDDFVEPDGIEPTRCAANPYEPCVIVRYVVL